jgi:tetratricopeptide (TPR) repeat protein
MRHHVGLIAIIVAVLTVTVAIAAASREDGETTPAPLSVGEVGGPVAAMSDVAVARIRCDQLEHRLDADPNDADLKLELADTYVTAERYRKAARLYRQLLDVETLAPVATVRLAAVSYSLGRRQAALRSLETAVRRWPELQEAHYQLALVAFAHQDLRLALAEWEHAADLDPESRLGRSAANFVALLAQGELGSPAPPQ